LVFESSETYPKIGWQSVNMKKESKSILGQWIGNSLYFSDEEKRIISGPRSITDCLSLRSDAPPETMADSGVELRIGIK